jgi:endogenous inhibitor of DNA gyrase (YacG/DUF329 family)
MTDKKTPVLYVDCPTCKHRVPWTNESPYKPFCSERCRLIDLGKWAKEDYHIPDDEKLPDDEPE